MKVVDVAVAIVTFRFAGLRIDCLRSIAAERSTAALDIRAVVVDNASGGRAVNRRGDRGKWLVAVGHARHHA
jgi:hypothetical protein